IDWKYRHHPRDLSKFEMRYVGKEPCGSMRRRRDAIQSKVERCSGGEMNSTPRSKNKTITGIALILVLAIAACGTAEERRATPPSTSSSTTTMAPTPTGTEPSTTAGQPTTTSEPTPTPTTPSPVTTRDIGAVAGW